VRVFIKLTCLKKFWVAHLPFKVGVGPIGILSPFLYELLKTQEKIARDLCVSRVD
jgi:hypothetical protein